MYEVGDKVIVLSRDQGQGRFDFDGNEGERFVAKVFRDGTRITDLGISRTKEAAEDHDWEVCIHVSRIDGDPAAQWRSDQQKTFQ